LCGGVPIKQLKEAAGTQRRLDMTPATAVNKPWVSLFDGNIRPSKDMDLRAFLRF